ncbi:MAG: alpha/beta fold hydrolase [Candidatus Curtissbacteria bacterium]|nr:alpha/beta fold hydrolase [Candidatus Curtissbacteria bacterium]
MKIRNFGDYFDTESVIELPNYHNSSWITLKSESGFVEGKLHRPEFGSQQLIIFEPGFPGDASTRLEKLWLNDLLKNNFTVFATRHNGTIINGKYSDNYLNCPEKQDWAKKHQQLLLGKKDSYTLADWLVEPLIALEALEDTFDGIFLIGHSFGGLAVFYSLIEFVKRRPDKAQKVHRIISLSGTSGKIKNQDDPILKQWADYLPRDSAGERVNVGEPTENLKILKNAYEEIHDEAKVIPESTEVICVMVENDELVPIKEAEEILTTLGRGYLVIDKTEKADENTGRLAHDMDNLPAEKFLDLVNIAWKPEQKVTTL